MFKTIFAKKEIKQNEKAIIDISVDFIRPNPYQPRKNFNKVSLEELCESIRNYGLLQPIVVRRMPNCYYELVAGERRLRAAKIIGLNKIPSIVVEISDNDSAILSIIENSQREELHFLEEAEAYYNIISEHNITQEELCKNIGKSQSTISNKIRLLKLPQAIRKILIEYNLTERHARALLKLCDEKIQTKILKYICDNKLSVPKTEELVEKTIERMTGVKNNKKRILFGAYKDLRIFVNTIKQAIDAMKRAGVKAKAVENDMGEYVEFNIKVSKT